MKSYYKLMMMLCSWLPFLAQAQEESWINLLDKSLSQWNTYLSYAHKDGYDGSIPKDSSGNEIRPIGYNKDDKKVFSTLDKDGELILRISGELYGSVFTKDEYQNYHLKMRTKWGKDKYEPRLDKLKDSGILYHSIGEAGVEHWRSWMLSHEFQVMEGHMGDYWTQANGLIDIRALPSESIMNAVADHRQPFRPFGRGFDFYCMRAEDHESTDGEWTDLELICYEGKSIHIVNGRVVMVLQHSRYRDEKGNDIPLWKGKIQLQSEAAEVFYKDIYLKELDQIPQIYQYLFEH